MAKRGRPPKAPIIAGAVEKEVEIVAEEMSKDEMKDKIEKLEAIANPDEPKQWVHHKTEKSKIVTVTEAKKLKKSGWADHLYQLKD